MRRHAHLVFFALACVALSCRRPAAREETKAGQPPGSSAAVQATVVRSQSATTSRRPQTPRLRVRVRSWREDLHEGGPAMPVAARVAVGGPSNLLELARTPDGHELWLRIGTDDGAVRVTHFSIDETSAAGGALQFVDGVFESRAQLSPEQQGLRADFFRWQGAFYEQRVEAWVVAPDGKTIQRPQVGESFPLIAASRGALPSALQWSVFSEKCAEKDSRPCVYFGTAEDVCGRYLDQNRFGVALGLHAMPAHCTGHW